MDDEKSETAGTKSLKTLRKVRTKFHTKRTVITIVPTKASSAAFSRVMGRSMNAAGIRCNSGFCVAAPRVASGMHRFEGNGSTRGSSEPSLWK